LDFVDEYENMTCRYVRCQIDQALSERRGE